MGTVLDIAFFVVGFTLVVVSLASAFRTVVMPRAAFDPITRTIFLGFRSVFVGIAKRSRYVDHETVLGAHAPLGLLTMALAWAVGLIFGFSLLFAATGDLARGDALVLAGSSFTTLGFAAPLSSIHEALSVFAAILGLFIVALLISYLPTIYGLFSRREVTVADVSIKSGGTAHGPDLVLHLTRVADTTRLDEMWVGWGHWLITLGETHTSEPSLNFYRSPRVHRSWLNAATAIVDAAALRNTTVAAPFSIRAEMTYRSGLESLSSIAHFFFVRPDGDDEHYTLLTRADFDVEVERLEADAVPLVEDLDEAWIEFAKLREAYEPYVLGLCELILPPPAPWSADLLERPRPDIPRRHGSLRHRH
jgi:hypothetical protein